MLYFLRKRILSGAIVTAVSEIARRNLHYGGHVPIRSLISIRAMMLFRRCTPFRSGPGIGFAVPTVLSAVMPWAVVRFGGGL